VPGSSASPGERLLSQAPAHLGDHRGGYVTGESVEVYSGSAGAWIEAVVVEVYLRACTADGYSMPAGCIKVESQAGVKYVMPDQVADVIRRPQAASRAASGQGRGSGGFAGRPDHAVQQPSSSIPAPTGRSSAGQERLEARDRWNTYEIRLQEIFMEYDKDRSGALEAEEFRALLRDFNDGRDPTEQEYNFMMRLSDKDHDGKINLGELHYALRAWHSYRHLDDSVLRLFAEFDFDESGRLDLQELGALLTTMNGGKKVPEQEVMEVMEQGDILGDGAINRSELLGAIAAWYGNVDRKDTDMPSLLREALARTIKETEYVSVFDEGKRSMDHAASMVKGSLTGYAQVDDGMGAGQSSSASTTASTAQPLWPPNLSALQGGLMPVDEDLARQPISVRLMKAAPFILSSCSKFCYVGFPFIFGWVVASSGWQHRDNECPRNLDGVLLWFGVLLVAFSALAYISDHNAVVGRIALAVILAVLNLVGFLWTMDNDVQTNKGACGSVLVWWSAFVWVMVPICSLGYGCYLLAAHAKGLRQQDKTLQTQVLVF